MNFTFSCSPEAHSACGFTYMCKKFDLVSSQWRWKLRCPSQLLLTPKGRSSSLLMGGGVSSAFTWSHLHHKGAGGGHCCWIDSPLGLLRHCPRGEMEGHLETARLGWKSRIPAWSPLPPEVEGPWVALLQTHVGRSPSSLLCYETTVERMQGHLLIASP